MESGGEASKETPSRIGTRTASERVSDRILAAMAAGVLQPGDWLPSERDLARMLGVSRTTVRKGKEQLVRLGMATAKRGRHGGTLAMELPASPDASRAIVRALQPALRDLEVLFDCHCLLEQLIARTAAERHSATDDAAMNSALGKYERARNAADSHAADDALHAAITRAARNHHLTELGRSIASHVNLGFDHGPYTLELHEIAFAQHKALVEAVTSSDADEAARIAGEHFHLTIGESWRSALRAAQAQSEDPSSGEAPVDTACHGGR